MPDPSHHLAGLTALVAVVAAVGFRLMLKALKFVLLVAVPAILYLLHQH